MYKVLLPLIFAVLTGCNKKQEHLHAVHQTITQSVYASGIVKSRDQYQVYAAANGLLKEVYVTEGDLVKKGQPLMRLSDVTARLNLENARIAAGYNSLQSNMEKLNQAKTDIDLAKARMDNDASLLERQRNLWDEGIGSKVELEQRELALKNSVNTWNQSKLRYDDLKRQLDFAARQSEKNLEVVHSTTEDLTVKAAVSGRIYRVLKEKGEMVTVQTPLAIMGDSSGFILELQVDEYDITELKPGQHIVVTMDSYKGQVFDAILTRIDPIMNELSKSFTVEATFVKGPAVLYPNLTLEANIITAVKQNALLVPRSCLLDGDYVLLANKEKRKVVIGLKDYEFAEVISGITESDELLRPE